MSAEVAIRLYDLPSVLREIDSQDERNAKFVALLMQFSKETGWVRDEKWLMAEVMPGLGAPWWHWHVAVVEAGTGVVQFTRLPVSAEGAVETLRHWGIKEASFQRRETVASGHNPYSSSDRPADSAPPDERSVYFLQAFDGGPIKIGVAYSPRARLSQIQSMSPVPLKVLGVVRNVGRKGEADLHQRFAQARSHGEWFHPTPDLIDYIFENAAMVGDES